MTHQCKVFYDDFTYLNRWFSGITELVNNVLQPQLKSQNEKEPEPDTWVIANNPTSGIFSRMHWSDPPSSCRDCDSTCSLSRGALWETLRQECCGFTHLITWYKTIFFCSDATITILNILCVVSSSFQTKKMVSAAIMFYLIVNRFIFVLIHTFKMVIIKNFTETFCIQNWILDFSKTSIWNFWEINVDQKKKKIMHTHQRKCLHVKY